MKNTIEQQQNGCLQTGVSTNRRFSLRNGILLVAGAIGLLAAGSGQAQPVFPLPFYEPFPSDAAPYSFNSAYNNVGYINNEELGQNATDGSANGSGYVWTFANGISSSCSRILITNGVSGLEYPGLVNVDATYQTGLLSMYIKDTGSTKDRAVQLSIPTNNRNAPFPIYASCLFSIQTNKYTSSSPFAFFGLSANNAPNTSVSHNGATAYVSYNGVNQNFQLQISKNSTTADTHLTSALTTSNTYLLVLRYNYTAGTNSNDSVDLWVDPIALGSNVTVPTPTISTTNNANLATNFFGAVAIFEAANPCIVYIDEIRVATNWGGVTPTNAWPGNIYTVTGGGAGCGSTSFDVGLSGSDTGVTYWLYTNGVPTGISANGTTGQTIDFGPQTTTALYTVAGSNNTTFNQGWMNGSASVSVLAAPSITTQPAPLTVPSGELGVFSVVSSGGGQMYQWYKGAAPVSGSEFSGAQSPNLVISPVASQDVGNYHVVITNACGNSVTSTTNALSLGSPRNLTWSGDGVSNIWDVAISENWSLNDNGTTNNAFFNYGDNVTFDDTLANTTVNLNSSYLSPSTITINGSANNYVFNGPGGLAGDGSIVVNSTANPPGLTLSLGLENTETGGITINSGATLTFNGAATLGTGVITLNGGQLAGGSSGAIYVNDVINVTGAGSSISVNAPGGQNLYLTNILQGTSGSLTFSNITTKNVGTALVILQYPSFTFNLPVDLDNGTAGGYLQLAGENTSGVQEWANVISGTGTMLRDGTGGETLLDATNTYSGGALLTAGPMGVANDSVLDQYNNLLAGPLGVGNLIIDTRGGGNPQIFASGAPHFVGNPITWYSNVLGSSWIISGSNQITFGGTMDLDVSGESVSLPGTNRVIVVSNTVSAIFTNVISDDGVGMGLTLTGTGNVYLDGPNTYTGTTTNSTDMLAGTGTVAGPVVVNSGATLGAGDPAGIGTFTLNGGLIFGGNLFIRVNNSLSPSLSNDTFVVTGGMTNIGSGTVTVSNLGPALAVGNQYALFNGPLVGGGSLTISGPAGVTWQNNLANDGTIKVASVVVPTPPSPSIVSVSASAGNLVFSGTNGTASGSFYVLSTTNLALPLSAWTRVSTTNTFGAGGVFSVSVPISGGGKFYILEVP